MWAQQALEIWVKCIHLYLFNAVDHNLTKLPSCNVLTLLFLFFSLYVCKNKDGVKEIVVTYLSLHLLFNIIIYPSFDK